MDIEKDILETAREKDILETARTIQILQREAFKKGFEAGQKVAQKEYEKLSSVPGKHQDVPPDDDILS